VKQKEEKLEHFLQVLIDAIPVPIFYKDMQGRYLGCNSEFERYIGFTKDEIVGKSIHDITPDLLAKKYYEMEATLFDKPGEQIYEESVVYRNGTHHNILFKKSPYFNENGTPNDPSDDKSAFVGGLNDNNDVTCLSVDKNGDIWVGTGLGVNIITNTYSITQSTTPQLAISSVFILRQQSINCILVDPLNQKWVGTNQGLFVVNQDGTTLLNVYNAENSPLLSDVIMNLAIDENTGTVYASTGAGLISFKTTSVKPVQSFAGLQVYPSPFKLTNGTNQLTIDGLIANTDIKILTISGSLVKEFTSPGGRIAFWDGRDAKGSLVSSGIYIIVAYDQDGNNVAAGKIAVLRE